MIKFASPFRVKIKGVVVATLEAQACGLDHHGCNVYALEVTNLTGDNQGKAELRLPAATTLPDAVYFLRIRAECGCFGGLVYSRDCAGAMGPGSPDNTTGGATFLGTGGALVPIPSCPEQPAP